MKTKKKAPIIRIKGFDGDWEQRKLGETLISLQNNTFSRADLSNEKGVAKNVHYGDVLIKFGEVLDVSKEQLPMITDEKVLTKYKASFLQNGDVIVADTAEDITVGKCSEIAGLNDEVVLSGLHTIPYRPVEKFATGYLGYYLNSRAYHNQLIPLMQGIKVTSISKSAMQDTDIVYPKSMKEQAMIGNYFQSIDNLITLHQWKCYFYEIIRLNDWEQRKLGDVADIVGGGTPSTGRNEFWDGDIDWYAPAEIADQIFVDSSERKITEEGLDNSSAKMLPIGTVLFTSRAGIGKMAILRKEACTNQGFQSIVPYRDKLDSYFIFSRAYELKRYGETVGAGSTFVEVSGKQMSDMRLMMPKSIEEQKAIGRYFEKLDHLITLHQRKYILYKNIKSDTEKQRKLCESEEKPKAKTLILA